jgi:hypothetical protein
MILQDLIKDFTINLAKVKQEHVSIILNYDDTLEVFKVSAKELKKLESGLTDMLNAVRFFNKTTGE